MLRISILLSALFLSACGGSGSSDSGTPAPGISPAKLAQVMGLYDTSTDDDEAYLYIRGNGTVVAYDYQGDSVGSGLNCYSLALDANQINSGLHGGSIYYLSETDRFNIQTEFDLLSFQYNEVAGMRNFIFNLFFFGVSSLTVDFPNVNVGGDGRLQTSSPTIEEIESMLCE